MKPWETVREDLAKEAHSIATATDGDTHATAGSLTQGLEDGQFFGNDLLAIALLFPCSEAGPLMLCEP